MEWMVTSGGLHHKAALVVQKAWRRYLFRSVFKFYKELISMYTQGDPRMNLKAVNPREGELLDAAAGVFIRFRLGGATFPPSIYYKIFTYRPVIDLCACSPAVYTKARNVVDQPGWYQRLENNNWRLFNSMRLPKGESEDCNDEKRIDFHITKLQRQQDVNRWKKKKKMNWLRLMYDSGRLESRLGQVAPLVDDSTQEVVGTDAEDIMEWEIDELLAWSDSLNFEEYMTQWRALAYSKPSEMSIGPFHYVALSKQQH